MKGIYKFIGMEYPEWNITKEVDDKSLYLGKGIKISNEIENMCSELHLRLQNEYEKI